MSVLVTISCYESQSSLAPNEIKHCTHTLKETSLHFLLETQVSRIDKRIPSLYAHRKNLDPILRPTGEQYRFSSQVRKITCLTRASSSFGDPFVAIQRQPGSALIGGKSNGIGLLGVGIGIVTYDLLSSCQHCPIAYNGKSLGTDPDSGARATSSVARIIDGTDGTVTRTGAAKATMRSRALATWSVGVAKSKA